MITISKEEIVYCGYCEKLNVIFIKPNDYFGNFFCKKINTQCFDFESSGNFLLYYKESIQL